MLPIEKMEEIRLAAIVAAGVHKLEQRLRIGSGKSVIAESPNKGPSVLVLPRGSLPKVSELCSAPSTYSNDRVS